MRRQQLQDLALSLVAPAFVLAGVGRAAWRYQKTWAFGRWMMPQTLVAADGLHYPSGERIDQVTLAMVRADCEPEMALAGIAFLLMLACLLYRVYVGLERNRLRLLAALSLEKFYRERREAAAHTRSPS